MLRTVNVLPPATTVAVAYRLIVALSTTPPRSSQYGGTSVPPPQKLIRSGARARISMAMQFLNSARYFLGRESSRSYLIPACPQLLVWRPAASVFSGAIALAPRRPGHGIESVKGRLDFVDTTGLECTVDRQQDFVTMKAVSP